MILPTGEFAFDPKWYHSMGIIRIDDRTPALRKQMAAENKPWPEEKWPLWMTLFLSEGKGIMKLNFKDDTDEKTIDMYVSVLESVDNEPFSRDMMKQRLMERFGVRMDAANQPSDDSPGKENPPA